MIDHFREVRERVTALDAARYYGLEINRHGKALCPFHHEKTPSLSFKNGRYKCFGCGIGGDSIDYTARLLGLDALGAVRELNRAFALGLPLDSPPDRAERAAAQHRREISDTYRLFEEWRGGMIRQLNACFREGHLAMKSLETPADLDRLTDAQAHAIREQARFEWLADTLTGGTMAEQMSIFRERGQIGQLCNRILSNTPMKSDAA